VKSMLVRVVAFVCTTLVAALILNVALFAVLASNDASGFAPTECGLDEIECGRLMEFVYDDTSPLAALLLLLPALAIGWVVARPLMPTATDNGQRFHASSRRSRGGSESK
jgi:hypothetical protein